MVPACLLDDAYLSMRGFFADQLGQSIVEIALALPLMVFLLLGGTDMARGFAIQIAVQNGARAGAEATAVDFTPTGTETILHAQQEMNRTPGMDASVCNVQPAKCQILWQKAQADGVTACPNTPDPVTPCFVTVRVTYTFKTIIAWPLIPTVFNMDRKTIIRVFV